MSFGSKLNVAFKDIAILIEEREIAEREANILSSSGSAQVFFSSSIVRFVYLFRLV
jgi:hypothetical protein